MNRLHQVHWLARASLAFVFAYHGLVPKLIVLSPGEQVLLQAHGLAHATWLSQVAGVAELALAALLLMPRLAWPLLVAAAVLLGLLVDVAGMALCAVAWLSRQPPAGQQA